MVVLVSLLSLCTVSAASGNKEPQVSVNRIGFSHDGGAASLLRVKDSGPVETARGFTTINSDNTYYPGDFFHIEVRGSPDGRHGKAVTKEWVAFAKQIKRPDLSDFDRWYGEVKDVVSTEHAVHSYSKKPKAREIAENKVRKLNEKADMPFADNPRTKKLGLVRTMYQPIWDEHIQKVEILKVKPVVKAHCLNAVSVRVSGSETVREKLEDAEDYDPSQVYMGFDRVQAPLKTEHEGSKDKNTKNFTVVIPRNTPPGVYTVEVYFPVPKKGHNNPYVGRVEK